MNPNNCTDVLPSAISLSDLSVEVKWDDFFSAATDRLEEWGQAYVRYHGQKIAIEIESTFMGGDGLWANVKALEGYPFLSADVQAQGEIFGAWNCNGYRMRADLVSIEQPYLDELPRPEAEAQLKEATEWLERFPVEPPADWKAEVEAEHKEFTDWLQTREDNRPF